jgi:hypothetical protein
VTLLHVAVMLSVYLPPSTNTTTGLAIVAEIQTSTRAVDAQVNCAAQCNLIKPRLIAGLQVGLLSTRCGALMSERKAFAVSLVKGIAEVSGRIDVWFVFCVLRGLVDR